MFDQVARCTCPLFLSFDKAQGIITFFNARIAFLNKALSSHAIILNGCFNSCTIAAVYKTKGIIKKCRFFKQRAVCAHFVGGGWPI